MATTLPLGWIDPDSRTSAQQLACDAAVAKMPFFSLAPQGKPEVGTKILLTDLWSHPKVIESYGSKYLGTHQITGSCVWAGAQNVLCTLQMIETLKNHENEKLIIPFGLANYGRSRILGGLRGRGEGSFGSTYAQSCTEDGTPDSRLDDLDLPQYTVGDGWIWGRNVELDWSDSRFVPDAVAAEGKKHLIKSTAELKSAEAVRDAILNGYPVTRASMVFVNPGTASVRNGALIGSHNGRGGHQESWLGYWNHPQEGELIWEQNQWGMNVYGNDPGGGPGGGCWVRMETVERMCKSQGAEVFAFSQYEGYPAQPDLYDWVNNSFFS